MLRAAQAPLTLSQLRLSSFVAKTSYPSPIKGEGLIPETR
jgi:hypothetical protein